MILNNTDLEYDLLRFINYKELSFWDVKSYSGAFIQSNFDVVKLGKHIKHQNNKIKPNNFPEQNFEILGVNNKTGLFDAYIQRGQEINQPYKIVEDGFLAYNPYRINVGSIGLKIPKYKYKYISPAYVVFSCKTDLLPEYVFAMFKTERFNTIINENTTGSVRQNLSYSRLSQIEIPLPSIKEQKALAEAYQSKLNDADKLEQEASNLGEQIEKYLLKKLGIQKTKKTLSKKGLHFVSFKDIKRWDLWNDYVKIKKCSYPLIEFEKTIRIIKSKVHKLKTNQFKEKGKIPIVSQEVDFISGYTDLNIDPINSIDLPLIIFGDHSQTKKFIDFEFIVGADGVKIIKPDERFNPKFYFYYLETLNFDVSQKYTRHFKYLKKKYIPLPPIHVQNKIVENIQQMKESQKDKFQQAQQLKKQALLNFENTIFKPTE